MSTTELAIDLDRALDSAVADVGEALHLRRRAANEAALRRGLLERLEIPAAPSELEPPEAARRATALFILGRDPEVGPYALRSGDHRVLFLAGQSQLYRDRPVEAAETLAQCVVTEPRDERARLECASVQALLGRSDQARETLAPLADQTDRPQVQYVFGTIAEAEGDYSAAREAYEAALAQNPEHVDSLFRLAYQHDLSGDDDAAITLYERARRVKPVRANVLVNLGVLYEDRDEYQKAGACYREVLRQFPNHPRAKAFLVDADSSKSMRVDDDMERTEDRRNQLLRTPISDFELSVRSRNCLAKMNIESLGDLIQRTEAELLSYKNFGETSLHEIRDILTSKGLRLGMRREEVLAAAEAQASAMPTIPDIASDGPERSAAMATPIADLDLSVRSSKCMSLMGVQTVGELLEHTESEMLKTKNFGQTSLQEIKTKLASLGLTIKKS